MNEREIGVAEFRAECLKLIDHVSSTGEAVLVTKRGRPVARLTPIPAGPGDIVGAMRGSVLRYDDPFEPVLPEEAWSLT